jgi:hypothetical protein
MPLPTGFLSSVESNCAGNLSKHAHSFSLGFYIATPHPLPSTCIGRLFLVLHTHREEGYEKVKESDLVSRGGGGGSM